MSFCPDYYYDDYHTIAQCRTSIAEQVSSICNSSPSKDSSDFFTAGDWLNLLSPGNLVRPLLQDEDVGANVGSLWICYALGLGCLIIFIWLVFWIPRRLFNLSCSKETSSSQTVTADYEKSNLREPTTKKRVLVWILIGLCLAGAIGTIVAAQIYTMRIKNDVAETSCAVAETIYEFVYQPQVFAAENDFHGVAKLMQLLDATANVSKIYTNFVAETDYTTLGQFVGVSTMGVFAPVYWTDYMLSKQKYTGWLSREGVDRPFGLELELTLAPILKSDLAYCSDVPCVPQINDMVIDSETGPLDERVREFAQAIDRAVEEVEDSASSLLSKLSKVQKKHFDINDEITNGPITKSVWIVPTVIQALTMAMILVGVWFTSAWARRDRETTDKKKSEPGLRWFCYLSGWGCLVYFLLGSIGVCATLFFTQSCEVVNEDILGLGEVSPFIDLDTSSITRSDIEACLLEGGSGDLLAAHGYTSEEFVISLFDEPFNPSIWPIEEILRDKLNVLVYWEFARSKSVEASEITAVETLRSGYTDPRIAQASIDQDSIKTINRLLNQMYLSGGVPENNDLTLCILDDEETCGETDSTKRALINTNTVYNFDPQGLRGLDFGYLMAASDDLREVFNHVQSTQSETEVAQFANAIYIAAIRSAALQGTIPSDVELGRLDLLSGLIRDTDPDQDYNKWENRLLFDPCPPLEPCSPWFVFDDIDDASGGFGGLKLATHAEWVAQVNRFVSILETLTVDDLVKIAIGVLVTTNPFKTIRSVIDIIPQRFSCQVVRTSIENLAIKTCTRVGHHLGVLSQLWIILAVVHGGAYVLSFIWFERGTADKVYLPKPDLDSSDDDDEEDDRFDQFGFDAAAAGAPNSFRMQVMDKPMTPAETTDGEDEGIDRGLLIDAAMRGNTQVLKEGGDVVSQTFDANENSLLHLAAFYGHADAVLYLRGKCNVDHVNKLGYTAEGAVSVNQSMSPGQRDKIIRLLNAA